MDDAIRVVAHAFDAITRGEGLYPQRLHLPLRGGDALVMPGYDGRSYLGTKIVTVHDSHATKPGTTACYLLLDAGDGEPLLLCDGTALTALRTGAASGLATRRLGRANAATLALFGTGGQAAEQLAGVSAVRPIEDVRVVGRDQERAQHFVSGMRRRFPRVRIECSNPQSAIDGAQVIVTATNSSTPVFDGRWVEPGTHVNAIGSFLPSMREFDLTLSRRARFVVDQRAAVLAESGEVIEAVAEGILVPDDITELGAIGDGTRRSDDEITVFKTVGHAALDLFTAVALLDRLA